MFECLIVRGLKSFGEVGGSLGGPLMSRPKGPGWFPLPRSLCFKTSLPTPSKLLPLGLEA